MGPTKKSVGGGGAAKETVQSVKAKRKHSAAHVEKKDAGGGLGEIDSLFADKKKQQKDSVAAAHKAKTEARNRRKAAHNNNNNNNNNSKPPPNASSSKTGQWENDGLGGKYNVEGYTGRVEDGVKVFKTHLLQSSKSGTTQDCPFDCDCCYI